ncbi:PKD domain-containing protein [Fulvivirgaceae bacterium BMA12]|uniref:PKD domain-containing protein n=1 Tax=Agaribacillus aureus TaxID=3051825 RepID=A0ABT8LCC6_9BACT|nr:PKD domain-containing protein [Fulvivirgaceae bacterium BMA12]
MTHVNSFFTTIFLNIILVILSQTIPFSNCFAQPIACAGTDENICQGEQVLLGCNPVINGDLYFWFPAEGLTCHDCKNPIASPVISTEYTLTVTDADGKTASDKVMITINPNPKLADEFGSTDFIQCTGGIYTIEVWDASEVEGIDITRYQISWGDGTAGYDSNIPPVKLSHSYAPGQSYVLTYEITGSNSCSSVIEYPVVNITNPAISTGIPENASGCGPLELCFPIKDFENNDNSTEYQVLFGDGSDTLFTHPPPSEVCHIYSKESCSQPGQSFEFVINAINACATGTATASPIKIYAKPKPEFTIISGCVNEVTTFENNSIAGFNSTCSNNSTRYIFNYGDGSSDTLFDKSSVEHTYAIQGNYLVTLTAKNSTCDSAVFSTTICIGSPPVSAFDLNVIDVCLPTAQVETVNTTDTQSNCGQVEFLWTIDKPDGYTFRSTGTESSNAFNDIIDFYKAGLYKINLRYTNGCNVSDSSITVEIHEQITLSEDNIIGLPDQACAPYITNVTTDITLPDSEGYLWEISGTPPPAPFGPDNLQTPGQVVLQPGSYVVTLAVSNDCGASNSVSKNILIVDKIIADAGPDTLVCENVRPIPLNGNPPGGTWSKSGVTPGTWPCLTPEGLFDPICAGIDPAGHELLYTIGAGDCENQDTRLITVIKPPDVEAGDDLEFCKNTPPFDLDLKTDVSPAGGTWSGSGVNSGIFDPSSIGFGSFKIDYVINDPNTGCSNSDNFTITIPEIIVDAGDDLKICNNDLEYDLNTKPDISPSGGNWSGPGVSDNFFDPRVTGVGDFNLTYTVPSSDPNSPCTNFDNIIMTVTKVDVSAGADMQICINGGTVALNSKSDISPIGGTWSGPGVSDNIFDPGLTGAGDFDVTYEVTATDQNFSCTNFDVISIAVNEIVVEAGEDLEFCFNSNPFNLNSKIDVSPPNGQWQGPGITNVIFDPILAGIGKYKIEYSYKDQNTNCHNSDFIFVTTHDSPLVDAGGNFTICNNTNVQELRAAQPKGGIWEGPGITDAVLGNFSAHLSGVGKHVVTYSFTNQNGCTQSDSIEITVCQNPKEAVKVPTAFTPNGDALNDTFAPVLEPTIVEYWFQISSRSNDIVFETSDPKARWDGTFKGTEVHGVCGYKLHVTFASGLTIDRVGEILIIR